MEHLAIGAADEEAGDVIIIFALGEDAFLVRAIEFKRWIGHAIFFDVFFPGLALSVRRKEDDLEIVIARFQRAILTHQGGGEFVAGAAPGGGRVKRDDLDLLGIFKGKIFEGPAVEGDEGALHFSEKLGQGGRFTSVLLPFLKKILIAIRKAKIGEGGWRLEAWRVWWRGKARGDPAEAGVGSFIQNKKNATKYYRPEKPSEQDVRGVRNIRV